MNIDNTIKKLINFINKYSKKFLPAKLSRIVEKYLRAEIIRYLLVGAVSSLVFMFSCYLMYFLIPHTVTATLLGWIIGIVFGYFAHMKVTFNVETKHKTYVPKYIAFMGFNLIFNITGAWLLHDVIGIGYKLSILIISIIWPIISYFIMKFHVFTDSTQEIQMTEPIKFTDLFNIYPKTRPELSQEYQDVHFHNYQDNRNVNSSVVSMAARMERWMHHQVAKPLQEQKDIRILEVGAGTLNHLQYENNYSVYDVVEPFTALYENKPETEIVNVIYDSIFNIDENNKYDKICSIAVLEHLEELPYIIAKSALLMDKDAVFNFGIPSEGTPMWKLGYTMTTGIEFKKRYGLDYSVIMNYEHINTAKEIEQLCNLLFNDISYKSFGVCKYMSLYQYFECRQPNIELCQQLLQHYNNQQNSISEIPNE